MAFPLTNAKRALIEAVGLPYSASAAAFDMPWDELRAFSHSVDYKLRCAEHYMTQLSEQLKDFPAHAFAQAGGPNIFLVNLYLDGFLTAAVSASDVFGRELNLYFGQLETEPRFYLIDVLNRLAAAGKGAAIVDHLLPQVDPTHDPKGLIPLLKTYRNCSMHTRLIETSTTVSATLTYSAQRTGAVPQFKPICYLPDDPETFPCSYNSKIEALPFCESAFNSLTNILDGAYALIVSDLAAAGELPL